MGDRLEKWYRAACVGCAQYAAGNIWEQFYRSCGPQWCAAIYVQEVRQSASRCLRQKRTYLFRLHARHSAKTSRRDRGLADAHCPGVLAARWRASKPAAGWMKMPSWIGPWSAPIPSALCASSAGFPASQSYTNCTIVSMLAGYQLTRPLLRRSFLGSIDADWFYSFHR